MYAVSNRVGETYVSVSPEALTDLDNDPIVVPTRFYHCNGTYHTGRLEVWPERRDATKRRLGQSPTNKPVVVYEGMDGEGNADVMQVYVPEDVREQLKTGRADIVPPFGEPIHINSAPMPREFTSKPSTWRRSA